MLRAILPLLAGALVAAAAPAPMPRDWSTVAARATEPASSYVLGNPAAKVKLVEYISYTCPHCRHFTEESAAILKDRMVRSGSTSIEFRNMLHDGLDIAAATLARCVGPAVFPRYHAAVYAAQEAWVAKGAAWINANGAANAALAPEVQTRRLADASGLSAIARRSGATPAVVARCFATRAAIDRTIAAAQAQREDVTGTPAFEINGELVQRVGWAELEPMLRAAGAR